MELDEYRYQAFLEDLMKGKPLYLISVPSYVNYDRARSKDLWGVKEEFSDRIKNVVAGDYVVFFGASVGLSIYQLERGYFYDQTKIWDDDLYPHRVELSKTAVVAFNFSEFGTSDILKVLVDIDGNPYGGLHPEQAFGRSVSGRGGIFRLFKPREKENLTKILEEKLKRKSQTVTPTTSKMDLAVQKILSVYNSKSTEWKTRKNEDREYVVNKYGGNFAVNAIGTLEMSDLLKFLDEKENRHWGGIIRQKGDIEKGNTIEDLRKYISILLDESKDIQTRIDETDKNLKGFGPGLITAILLVAYPNKYCIVNERSMSALSKLQLTEVSDKNTALRGYKQINDIVSEISFRTNLNRWNIDWVFNELARSEAWWVEKTDTTLYMDQLSTETVLGKTLRSPTTSDDGKKIYDNMTKVKEGDKIIHLTMDQNNLFSGISVAQSRYENSEIPQGSKWTPKGPKPGYRVKLREYIDISPTKLTWDIVKKSRPQDLLAILDKHIDLFYNRNLELNQGKYLTPAPEELIDLLNSEYKLITQNNLPHYEGEEKIEAVDKPVGPKRKDNNLPKNIILYGPVGTGKTFLANLLARKIANETLVNRDEIPVLVSKDISEDYDRESKDKDKFITRVTFHQSYGYEEFMEGISADTAGTDIAYSKKDGVFKALCSEARKNKNGIYVLTIDEINRGDISRIFGELITTIEEERRCSDRHEGYHVTLPLKGDDFCVPENVYIIGTMNNTDRSIALLDVALRRRFTFFYVPPLPGLVGEWIGSDNSQVADLKNAIVMFLDKLNRTISIKKGPDSQIGHGFFSDLLKENDKFGSAQWTFKYKIIPLLSEQFYGENELLREVLEGRFLKDGKDDDALLVWKDGLFDAEHKNEFLKELQDYSESKNTE